MRQMEDRFNRKYGYPYVFLNEEPFSEEFKQRVTLLTDSEVKFGLIPHDNWYQPDWIDEEKAAASRQNMVNHHVIYGDSVPYRNMCRFNSGFFWRHELLKEYKYYWRIEPDVKFFCDLDYDPFLMMQDQGKVYGFTIILPEYGSTIRSLWRTVTEFIEKYPQYLAEDNAMDFISDDGGETYNRCHSLVVWSNFEIGDLDFWRGEAYTKFFEFLDSKGGFYYERWGDAPVHSIGAALFARKDQIHFFNDIGYRHEPFQHCPQGELHNKGKCWCDPKVNVGKLVRTTWKISLHTIISFTHEGYGKATSLSTLKDSFYPVGSSTNPPYKNGVPEEYHHKENITSPQGRRANAAFVLLARNGDLNGVASSMKQMEDRFNKKFKYPYVFLNEEPFSDEFKNLILAITDAEVKFGLIPREHWFQPDWIDEDKAKASRDDMVKNNVIYGGSVPYRNMCRFNSGFFFKHELLKDYKYYWRIEPDVKFFCDLDYDPFLIMEDQKKVYGFTISLPEYEATIPTLWEAVKEFNKANPQYLAQDNAMGFISDDGGLTYNRCHFWSNFEIGDLDFWRGEAYTKFFDFLDSKGGFYYERWGDAPVHSIGAALFAQKDQIHFFTDIGYKHEPFQHCPQGESHSKGKCWCDPTQNFDYEWYSCLNKYDALFK
ncbi:hypothetical protein AAF712_001254 [Marasmius tenuissimus]|uniref:Glycosyltransferase family 15 protein n=1 Tax=Marasmius tenuissimus TaxID=585030 RepID=A0ABR3AFP7_9AGAR